MSIVKVRRRDVRESLLVAAAVLAAGLGAGACGGAGQRAKDAGGKDGPGSGGYDAPAAAACGDSVDNDGDGKTDWPNDPGCTSAEDDDETAPATPPECSNGIDDDGDGKTDWPADPGCRGAGQDDEARDPLACGAQAGLGVIDITKTATVASDFAAADKPGPNVGSCGGADGRERIYLYRVPAGGKRDLLVTTVDPATSADTVLYVRSACDDPASELAGACNDDASAAVKASELWVRNAAPGAYYVFVEGKPSAPGTFRLKITSYLAAGEPCMAGDGGAPGGDAAAPPGITGLCSPALLCRPASGTCGAPGCGNGADDDGDGKTDWPSDPGCSSAADDDETDPNPEPPCGNGVDDDGDGKTDWPSDPGCSSAADDDERDECVPGLPIGVLTMAGVFDMTAGLQSLVEPSSACNAGSPAGPERVYQFEVPEAGFSSLKFSTDSADSPAQDTIVYLRAPSCDKAADQVACNNDVSAGDRKSTVVVKSPTQGQRYYVFVDTPGNGFKFHLTVTATVPEGAACVPGATDVTCDPGLLCKGPGGMETCTKPACGNGVDDDGDGKTDFPYDPGCDAGSDDDESDDCPDGLLCPQCSNGVDDDGDGKTDYPNDTACMSAAGQIEISECIAGVPVTALTDAGVDGSIAANAPDKFSGTCMKADFFPRAEKVFVYAVKRVFRTLTFATSAANFDTALYVRQTRCDKGELDCSDATSSNGGEKITITAPTATNYFVFVDQGSFTVGTSTFHLGVSGVLAANEPCDPAVSAIACESPTTCQPAGNTHRCLP